MVSDQQVRDKIDLFERVVERKFESLDSGNVPEKNFPKLYRTMGMKYQALGLYKLSLEECDAAVSEFITATKWYRDSVRKFRQRRDSPSDNFEGGTTLLKFLYCAVFSREEDLAIEASKLALETSIHHYRRFSTEWRYYYMKALAASILGTKEQEKYLNKMEQTLAHLDGTTKTFFEALWNSLSGLIDKDTERFCMGIKQILEWHDGKVDFENKTSAKDLVCQQAASLLVLAQQKGMEIRVDSEYIPECVYDIAD